MLVLASDVRRLRTREILVVKVQWRHRPIEEATWEIESEMWAQYPHLFETSGTFLSLTYGDESFLVVDVVRPFKLLAVVLLIFTDRAPP